jgi:hypothetical protein
MLRVAAVALWLSALLPAQGKVLLSIEEALELAFEEAEVTRTMRTLDDAQRERVAELCGQELERSLVYPYVATRDGAVVGTAYFDVHRVRTLRETLMVVVRPDGTIGRVELLAFGEPADYIPRDVFYAQFVGRPLDEELNLKRSIRGITGATLSARSTVDCGRRVLAIHRALAEARTREEEKGDERGDDDRGGSEGPRPGGGDSPAPSSEPETPASDRPDDTPAPRPDPGPTPGERPAPGDEPRDPPPEDPRR